MNEQVEEIYNRMFAPEPIPQSVVKLFDRTKFYLDRVDSRMSVSVMALIAATATTPAQQQALPKPKLPDTIDTSEPAATTESVQPEQVVQPGAPTGPMDAPITKTQGNPKTDLQLQHMSARELKVHAKQFYGKDWPLRMGKKQMIVALKALNKANAAR